MNALLSFVPVFRLQGRRFLLAMTLSLCVLATGVALLGLSGWFLTAAFLSMAGASFNIFGPSSAVRGLSLVRILSRYGEKLVGHDGALRVLADIREWLFRSLLPKGASVLGRGLRHGDVVSRLTSDVDALDVVILAAIGPMVTAIGIGAIVTAVVSWQLPMAGPFYGTAMAVAALVVPLCLAGATRRSGREVVRASSALRIELLDGFAGHADIVALGASEAAEGRVARASQRVSQARLRLARFSALASSAILACGAAAMMGILVPGIESLRSGMITGPVLVALILAALGSFEASSAIVRSVARLGSAVEAAERLRSMADVKPRVEDANPAIDLPAGADIAFHDVRYAYPNGRPVLHGIELAVAAGERVAILGASGCGKSTLLSLLLRLDDIDDGAITVAGVDIRRVPQTQLHDRIALLEQDAPVFLGTIRENLRIGREEAVDGELWDALEKARLAVFVRTLPEGLDTQLGEAGKTISAGQARRLCLARVLLSTAEIIVLDEPTSGLDRETETQFMQDLGPATKGRTVLLVTHASLPSGTVDRCVEMRNGSVGDDQPPTPDARLQLA